MGALFWLSVWAASGFVVGHLFGAFLARVDADAERLFGDGTQ